MQGKIKQTFDAISTGSDQPVLRLFSLRPLIWPSAWNCLPDACS
jgi:hypothetical protein